VKSILAVGIDSNGAASGTQWLRNQRAQAHGAPSAPQLLTSNIFMRHVLRQSGQEGSFGPGSVEPSAAWPATASCTSHMPGSWWAEEKGWQEGQNSWVKAEFGRKEIQQDGKTAVEYSCLHCQRTLTGPNATQLKSHLLNPGACKFLYSTSA